MLYPMQDKIKRVVNKILTNIVNPELRELVKEKTFLTGGCFKAIYHGEKVNDYDFYFIDEASALRFKELVEQGLNKLPDDPFTNREELRLAGWLPTAKTQFAMTFKLEDEYIVQFITKYTGSPEKVTDNFDFEHAMNYYMLKTDTFYIDHSGLKSKELIFNSKASHPINALKRLKKFLVQGWTIEDTELIKMAEAINAINLDTYSNWKEQTAAMYCDHQNYDIMIFNNNVAIQDRDKRTLIKWVD